MPETYYVKFETPERIFTLRLIHCGLTHSPDTHRYWLCVNEVFKTTVSSECYGVGKTAEFAIKNYVYKLTNPEEHRAARDKALKEMLERNGLTREDLRD